MVPSCRGTCAAFVLLALVAGGSARAEDSSLCVLGDGRLVLALPDGVRLGAPESPPLGGPAPAGVACDREGEAFVAWYGGARTDRASRFVLDGEQVRESGIPGVRGRIRAALVSSGQVALAVERRDRATVLLVPPSADRRPQRLDVPAPVAALALEPGGRRLLVAGGRRIRSFTWPEGRTGEIWSVGGEIRGLAAGPSGTGLLAAAFERGVAIYDLDAPRERGALEERDALALGGASRLSWEGPRGGWILVAAEEPWRLIVLSPFPRLRVERSIDLRGPARGFGLLEPGHRLMVLADGRIARFELPEPPAVPPRKSRTVVRPAPAPDRPAAAEPPSGVDRRRPSPAPPPPAEVPKASPPSPRRAPPAPPPPEETPRTSRPSPRPAPPAPPPPAEVPKASPPPPRPAPPAPPPPEEMPKASPPSSRPAPPAPPPPAEMPRTSPPSSPSPSPVPATPVPAPKDAEPAAGEIVVLLTGRADLARIVDVRGPDNLLRPAGTGKPGAFGASARIARIRGLAPGRYAIVVLGRNGASLATRPARALVRIEKGKGAKVEIRVLREL